MAFMSLIIVFLLMAMVGFIAFIALILLIVGIVKYRKHKKIAQQQEQCETMGGHEKYKMPIYPKVLIGIGLVVIIPFVLVCGKVIWDVKLEEIRNRDNLFLDVADGNLEEAQKIIDTGASPDRISDANVYSNEAAADGEETLLMHFCGMQGSDEDTGLKEVKFLLENGADVNRREWQHEKEDPEHQKNYGYEFSLGDGCGKTPLMVAIDAGNVKTVEILIENGANVNDADYCGKTPLMYAASSFKGERSIEMLQILLEAGADKEAVDNYGQNVTDYLAHYGMMGVEESVK